MWTALTIVIGAPMVVAVTAFLAYTTDTDSDGLGAFALRGWHVLGGFTAAGLFVWVLLS